VKWGVGTETEPKLHFRSVSAPKPKPNFGRSLLLTTVLVSVHSACDSNYRCIAQRCWASEASVRSVRVGDRRTNERTKRQTEGHRHRVKPPLMCIHELNTRNSAIANRSCVSYARNSSRRSRASAITP